jgi:hypothetical protein
MVRRRNGGTALTFANFLTMGDAAERFRARAEQCRELARTAKDEHDRRTLTRMADELDAEAALIESDDRRNSAGK